MPVHHPETSGQHSSPLGSRCPRSHRPHQTLCEPGGRTLHGSAGPSRRKRTPRGVSTASEQTGSCACALKLHSTRRTRAWEAVMSECGLCTGQCPAQGVTSHYGAARCHPGELHEGAACLQDF